MNLPVGGLTSTASTAITNILSAVVREAEHDPVTALETLALDAELQSLVAPLLQEVGYRLDSEDIVSEDLDARAVTVARNGSVRFFIITVPAWVLEQVNSTNRAAVSAIGYLFPKDSRIYLIARDLTAMDLAFDLMICKQWKERLSIHADFIPWNHLMAASKASGPQRRISINRIFKFDQASPAAPPASNGAGGPASLKIPPSKPQESSPMNVDLKAEVIDSIVNILSPRAADPLLSHTPQEYFNDLVAAAHLPQGYRQSVAGQFSGNAKISARRLVESAIVQKINSADPRYTVLGGLLKALLDQGLSPDDARLVVATLNGYGLILDTALNEDLRVRYGVPKPASERTAAAATAEYGPDFEWLGPSSDVQLQSFFSKPEPAWLDVGFLLQAMKCSAAVCRVEIGERKGTGFRVGKTLVLTNYHVLKYDDSDDINVNASKTTLRFGCLSTGGDASTGQPFKLASNPIVEQSPIKEHDFVLLRVEDKIESIEAITLAPLDPSLPAQGSSLNIIHHPGGDTMKLSLSGNGISGIYQDRGLLQYATTAAEGSSGSPCFNDDWKVVGIHHAQRARPFGSIREGILIQAIYDRIKGHVEKD